MTWKEKLDEAVDKRSTLLCVGLDTDMTQFEMDDVPEGQFGINRDIIDATGTNAAAFKLNAAFYEAEGARGWEDLARTVAYINDKYPEVLTILDAKRGDIGNTSKAYARSAFEHLGVDSITLNGYMGKDSVSPFSAYADRLSFVLCRTSNPSAGEVQDLRSLEEPLYLKMARLVLSWNDHANLGLVVGATYPAELAKIRRIVGYDLPLLVPGVGSQGGDLDEVLKVGTDDRGAGILINISRDIMFAYRKKGAGIDMMAEYAAVSSQNYIDRIKGSLERLGRW